MALIIPPFGIILHVVDGPHLLPYTIRVVYFGAAPMHFENRHTHTYPGCGQCAFSHRTYNMHMLQVPRRPCMVGAQTSRQPDSSCFVYVHRGHVRANWIQVRAFTYCIVRRRVYSKDEASYVCDGGGGVSVCGGWLASRAGLLSSRPSSPRPHHVCAYMRRMRSSIPRMWSTRVRTGTYEYIYSPSANRRVPHI